MKKTTRYVIGNATPRRFGFSSFVAAWLLLDKLHTPQEVMGLFIFFSLIRFFAYILDCIYVRERETDIQLLLRDRWEEQNQVV